MDDPSRSMIRQLDALEQIERITVTRWHEMADLDLETITRCVKTREFTGKELEEIRLASRRLRLYSWWARARIAADDLGRAHTPKGQT